MSIIHKNLRIFSFAMCATLLSGAPAIADDTELLLVNPGTSAASKPNVMFILDTSGSMTSEEETVEPYDSNQTYAGDCDSDQIYWTDVNVTPGCDGGNTRSINKAAFHCQAASKQINGIGSFSSTMVQYRPDVPGAAETWQDLQAGNFDDPVECQADRGIHGDGTTGQVWASALSGLQNPWTSNQLLEISWGSSPRNVSYTVFDGNYLNWRENPELVQLSRNEIMRTVVTTVLKSLD